ESVLDACLDLVVRRLDAVLASLRHDLQEIADLARALDLARDVLRLGLLGFGRHGAVERDATVDGVDIDRGRADTRGRQQRQLGLGGNPGIGVTGSRGVPTRGERERCREGERQGENLSTHDRSPFSTPACLRGCVLRIPAWYGASPRP